MHIDKDGVFDPQAFYNAAGLNNDKVEDIIRRLEQTMRKIHIDVFGEEPQGDIYTGADIKELARLRMKPLPNNSLPDSRADRENILGRRLIGTIRDFGED